MSRILIEYCPPISAIGCNIIEANVTASMISDDGSTNQFEIDMVAETLRENNLFDDLNIINELIKEGVSFIEF